MRRSYYDVGWVVTADGRVAGLSLGYDRCAEHEWGIAEVLERLGVALPDAPLGVADRLITEVPQDLVFKEYKAKPQDKRRKAFDAAFLELPNGYGDYLPGEPKGPHRDAAFFTDPDTKNARPQDDIGASWNSRSFCINVRGAENIARLKDLYAAFQRKDIAVALPWTKSFFQGGISFVIASALAEAEKQDILDRDLAHKKLHDAALATGIHQVLKDAGRGWYALSPDWVDREMQTDVAFFLNPREQSKYNHGWFTTEELCEWAEGKGPVVMHRELEEFQKRPENRNWAYRLTAGLNEHGVRLRFGAHLVWFDETSKVPGVKLRVHKSSAPGVLESGTYRFEQLMERFAAPLQEASVELAKS